jgi:hypothetical protein
MRGLGLDGVPYLVWTESAEASGPLSSPIQAARIALEGTLAPPSVVFEPPPGVMYATIGPLVAGHERLTVAWDYMGENETTWLPTWRRGASRSVLRSATFVSRALIRT